MSAAVHPFDDAKFDASLAAAIADPEVAANSELFAVRGKDQANKAVWRLGRILAQLAEDERLYIANRDRLDEWIEARRGYAERARQVVEGVCASYHRAQLAADPRAKTIPLPAGDLVARKAPDQWLINDPELIAWAEVNEREDLIRRKGAEVDRPAVKRLLTPDEKDHTAPGARVVDSASGELVPGVRVVEGEVQYKVKPHEAVET